ncbi:MAG: beta-aspartyl-peptidase [Tenuifilaceae bacterium]
MTTPTFLLITQAEVYSPDFIGVKDILISGSRIIAISDKIDLGTLKNLDVYTINAKGKKIIPGLIDAHVHIAGAGGEGGPSTRTPEMQISQMLAGGITTVIGCLGTDGVTRIPDSVLMKVKSLRVEGVSAWMYTGSYQVPTPTITGSIDRDLALIEEVIGVGEIALSDHRSSCPSTRELIRIAEQARVGGMLGGKAGIVNIHLGDALKPFNPIIDAVNQSELRFKQFFPTHCNRNTYIFEDAKTYGKEGYVDLTTSSYPYFPDEEVKPSKAIIDLMSAGVPLEHITMTSDGNGSLPRFDDKGELVRLDMGQPMSIFTEMIDAVTQEKLPLESAVKVITSNVAQILKLKTKGRIQVNFDADLVILNSDYTINDVIAKGVHMVKDSKALFKGTYE